MSDDFLHGLEAEMAGRQREVWRSSADLERAWLARLEHQGHAAGVPVFEWEPAEVAEAAAQAEAFEAFPAVDRDEGYDDR